MEYAKLGASDLTVSRICLGCMGFGDPAAGQHSWTVGEDGTREIVRRALDAGVNFFDTAIAYIEEPYAPHAIVGVMAQNKPADAGKEHVWLANAKYLKGEGR